MTALAKLLHRGKKSRAGFTLVELIVVIVIIAILAAALVVSLTGYIRKAKVAAVIADGRMAYEAAQSLATEQYAKGWTGGPTADEALALSQMKGEIVTMTFSTPGAVDATADKPFRYKENGITVKYADLAWSEDKDDAGSGGGSGSASTYPGTTIAMQTSAWPTDADYANSWDTVTLQPGGVFQYTDGAYYIVTKSVQLNKTQAASGPGGQAYNWYSTQKLTGRVITDWSDGSQKSDLKRGDLVLVNGVYYVYIDGGTWAYAPDSPNVSGASWYRLPG